MIIKAVLRRLSCAGLLLAAALPGAISLAHHAAQAQFEVETITRFEGTLVKIEMINPHPQLYFEVMDKSGISVQWRVAAPAIVALRRAGVLRTLEIGDAYTIEYAPSRNGEPIALMIALTNSEGVRYGVNLGGQII